MSATSVKPRLTQLAILAVVIAAIAVAVAMCGPSNNTSNNPNTGKPTVSATPPSSPPRAAPPPAPPPPAAGKDYVEGLVESVSGNAIQLRTRSGSATVDFTPATKVTELTPAQLSDVTEGSCVNVRAAPEGAPAGDAITAQSVTISPAVDGKCLPLPAPGSGSAPPSGPPPAAPAGVSGKVATVSGNTIAVTGTDPAGNTTHTQVNFTSGTTYSKQAVTNTQAIEHGKCMGAQGTNSGGVLQATTISLQPCPPMGRPHHHIHLPHLPFHL